MFCQDQQKIQKASNGQYLMDKMFGMDRYDRNARLHPALLALLSAFLFVFVWFPQRDLEQRKHIREITDWLLAACGRPLKSIPTPKLVQKSSKAHLSQVHESRLTTHAELHDLHLWR